MLGSSSGRSTGTTEDRGHEVSSVTDMLVECARAAHEANWQRCVHLLGVLVRHESQSCSDARERVVAHFTDGIAAYVLSFLGRNHPAIESLPTQLRSRRTAFAHQPSSLAYLAFNHITPFSRFCRLTANQAILEAFDGYDGVHILDLQIMQGIQSPLLLQALAQRSSGAPTIRLSGAGSDPGLLQQTGEHLRRFAASLGISSFEFVPLHADSISDITSLMEHALRPGEARAVNCILQLQNLGREEQAAFVRVLHSLEAKVITVVERKADYNQAEFADRFASAFRQYLALFESLEATLPPSNTDRNSVENACLRHDIMSLLRELCRDGQCPKLTNVLSADQVFTQRPHTAFARAQAQLLLRLHYPSEGYQLSEEENCLSIGWRGTWLFEVSAWN